MQLMEFQCEARVDFFSSHKLIIVIGYSSLKLDFILARKKNLTSQCHQSLEIYNYFYALRHGYLDTELTHLQFIGNFHVIQMLLQRHHKLGYDLSEYK